MEVGYDKGLVYSIVTKAEWYCGSKKITELSDIPDDFTLTSMSELISLCLRVVHRRRSTSPENVFKAVTRSLDDHKRYLRRREIHD